ncbi:hypothetical protein K437DRAFT_258939 [Tilletiaria anomala UBC 951]|uniref:N-acetyltransferase domain-containing protein n=1 Tax=Tilletiaria anomala (strain ATCC 24038 / CBS 436.72 / UBC 951) TaxID=1037660 RepID=A0A066VE75_TILAU|nr:uncharacterized protein K437DRAFT_258939 [Tilletiaria anomala UBC 951]KDN39761.1 hypothetical protein K437DRAFT_258939 [Tilletiaria anomala UBC 951]
MVTTAAAATASSSYPLPPTSYSVRKSSSAPVRSQLVQTRIARTDLTPNNIGTVRKLNAVLLPVTYSERFYKDALKEEVRNICKIGLFNDIPVSNLICRYEPQPESAGCIGKVKVYVMTLGVLAPYRRLGIASNLISHLLTVASSGTIVSLPDPDAPPSPAPKPAPKGKDGDKKKAEAPKVPTKDYEIESIYLHVQTSNEEARKFYEKHGFKVVEELPTYYRQGVVPRSAWVLEYR